MTDPSNIKPQLRRLPLRTIIKVAWLLERASLLWLARVTDRYDGAAMRGPGASSRAPSAVPLSRTSCGED